MTAIDTASARPAEAELDENAAMLAACEAEAKRAGVRLPRRAEDRNLYLLAIARGRGVVPQDAHVGDPAGTTKQLLERAGEDELFGGSPAGRALIVGAAIWDRMNPKLEGVGQLRASGRRGVHIGVAALLQELQQGPTRAQRLSPAEVALLRYYASDVHQAVEELGRALDAAYARLAEVAKDELQRPVFWDLVPREPAVQEAPVISFTDTRAPFPGAELVRDAAGQVVAHVAYGDQQLPNVGRTEPATIPTAALRPDLQPRGW